MFDNKTGIVYCGYRLELENIINAICNISFDIGIQIENLEIDSANEIEYAKELFVTDLLKGLSIKKRDLEAKDASGKYNYSKEAFFSEISNYYNNNIFYNNVMNNYLKDSDILLINKKETFFYTFDEKRAKSRIISAIEHVRILNDIIKNIKNVKIKNSLSKINLFEHPAFYSNTIKTNRKEGQPILPIVNFNFIDKKTIDIKLDDFDNYWINVNIYKKKYGVTLGENSEIQIVTSKNNNSVLGLLIDGYLIPYSNVDLSEYILGESLFEYYSLLFKWTYSENSNKTQNKNELVQKFIAKNKDKKLNQLLSHLKNNLYLDNTIKIEQQFKGFFNKVALIEKLEYLEEYEFIIPQNTQKETALGVYSTEKKGSSYNLLHWLNHRDDNNVSHFRGNLPIKKINYLYQH